MDSNVLDKMSALAEGKWGAVPKEFPGFLLAAYSLGRATAKSVDSIVQAYEDSLRNLANEAVAGTITSDEMARSHRILLRGIDSSVFLEGLAQGGVTRELTASDEKQINGWLLSQLSHVESLSNAAAEIAGMEGEERSSALAALEDRIIYWVDNARSLADLGFASARKNMMVEFRLGGTREHCETCARLDGTRHRLSWYMDRNLIPRRRGNAHFDCGGWKCQCDLVTDDGRSVLN